MNLLTRLVTGLLRRPATGRADDVALHRVEPVLSQPAETVQELEQRLQVQWQIDRAIDQVHAANLSPIPPPASEFQNIWNRVQGSIEEDPPVLVLDATAEQALLFAALHGERDTARSILEGLTPDVMALPIPTPVRDVLEALQSLYTFPKLPLE